MTLSSGEAGRGWKNRIVGHGEEAPDQLLANPLVVQWIYEKPRSAKAVLDMQSDSISGSVRWGMRKILCYLPCGRSTEMDKETTGGVPIQIRQDQDSRAKQTVEGSECASLSVTAEGLSYVRARPYFRRGVGALWGRLCLLWRVRAVVHDHRSRQWQWLGAPETDRQNGYVEVGTWE